MFHRPSALPPSHTPAHAAAAHSSSRAAYVWAGSHITGLFLPWPHFPTRSSLLLLMLPDRTLQPCATLSGRRVPCACDPCHTAVLHIIALLRHGGDVLERATQLCTRRSFSSVSHNSREAFDKTRQPRKGRSGKDADVLLSRKGSGTTPRGTWLHAGGQPGHASLRCQGSGVARTAAVSASCAGGMQSIAPAHLLCSKPMRLKERHLPASCLLAFPATHSLASLLPAKSPLAAPSAA